MKRLVLAAAVIIAIIAVTGVGDPQPQSIINLIRSNASDEFIEAAIRRRANVNERFVAFSRIYQGGYGWQGCSSSYLLYGGLTPLHMALFNNRSLALVNLLINSGADLKARDFDGNTVLHYAVANCTNQAIVTRLIQAGLSVQAVNRFGQTPVAYALNLSSGYSRFMESTPANMDLRSRYGFWGSQEGVMTVAQHVKAIENNVVFLIPYGVANTQDKQGRTLVMLAAMRGNNELLRRLIPAGPQGSALVNKKDYQGANALHLAVQNNGDSETITLLLAAGADAKSSANGGTPFQLAIERYKSRGDHQLTPEILGRLSDLQY